MEALLFEAGRQITAPYSKPGSKVLESFTFKPGANRIDADVFGAIVARSRKRSGGSPFDRLMEVGVLRDITPGRAAQLAQGAELAVSDGVNRVSVPEPSLPDHLVPPAAREMEDRLRRAEPKSVELEVPDVKPPPRPRA
ncbi:MAG: hypothetical protein HY791_02940 [Deltaproteobacteria bacterium]|nr:hypothetical protein [Deltaproteobacteria bacterium]